MKTIMNEAASSCAVETESEPARRLSLFFSWFCASSRDKVYLHVRPMGIGAFYDSRTFFREQQQDGLVDKIRISRTGMISISAERQNIAALADRMQENGLNYATYMRPHEEFIFHKNGAYNGCDCAFKAMQLACDYNG